MLTVVKPCNLLTVRSWNVDGSLICDDVKAASLDTAVTLGRGSDSVKYEIAVESGRVIESAVLIDDTADGGMCWWEEEMTGARR